ncbi:MAG: amino acid adenylation domain-containing protein, partial [Verrucomicrobiales bacterium]|nr:amino acid adenylation domain-containing protein [Verrucomicrobiales bacterium]
AVQSFKGACVSKALTALSPPSIKRFCADQEVTQFMLFLAAFQALLHRYSGTEEFVVGSPISGRTRWETEGLIGFFVNTLALRADFRGAPTFRKSLQRVRETTLDALANQDLPLEKLVEEIHPGRSSSHLPLVQVMFATENGVADDIEFPGLILRQIDAHNETAKFDLIWVIRESRQGLKVVVEYSTDLFERATIERFLRHFEILLAGAVTSPDEHVTTLPLLTPPEREEILVQWNATETGYPREASIVELFEAQASRTPESEAVVFGSTRLTYRELNARANGLAQRLRDGGVAQRGMVGICLERSAEMIVAWLAVLKAGAAYVPLDPIYPKERLAFMVADADISILLTERRFLPALPPARAKLVCLDESPANGSEENPVPAATARSLAYVIYTSGSTGRPKGVLVPHRAVVRLVRDTNYINLISSDRVAQASNASFDAATFEVWGALLNGAVVVGIPRQVILSPREFSAQLRSQRITTLFLTTALFNQMAREVPGCFRGLKHLLFGGEAVDPKSVRHVLAHEPPQRLLHVYGPTETTTFASWFLVEHLDEEAGTVPIGRPIANTEIYLLDRNLQPVPPGLPGEIYIGGDGLADGYLNQPEATAQKFVPHPFATDPAARLYKTGDLARFRDNGMIEFIGRADHQVKLRGFRVELGEIEAVLASHAAVRECVVVAHDAGEPRGLQLVAYFVPRTTECNPAGKLRTHLQQKLPEYMVPATFVAMPALPLNENGKVARHELPLPNFTRVDPRDTLIPAGTADERVLVEIWERVLGIHPIGVTDNFFSLGGHSLLAVRLFSEIESAWGKKLPLATLFRFPTIREIAGVLRSQSAGTGESLIVEIQPHGNRPPFFWIHSLGGDGGGGFFYYRKLAELLGPDQPSYGIRSPGEPFTEIESMAAHYVAQVRSFQPKGPYFLGGFCFGGAVAYEMARQLRESSEEIALLALIESALPARKRGAALPNPRALWPFLNNLRAWLIDLIQLPPAIWLERFRRKRQAFQRKLHGLLSRKRNDTMELTSVLDLENYPKAYVRFAEAHWKALINYRPKPLAGRITLFRARKQPLSLYDPALGWAQLASEGVRVNIVPGTHETILEEPVVQLLARELKICLLEAQVSGLKARSTPALSQT